MNKKTDNLLKFLVDKCSAKADDSACGALSYAVKADMFAEIAKAFKEANFRLAAEWASDESLLGKGFGLYAAYVGGADYIVIKANIPAENPKFQSITKHFLAAYRFERQIHSLMGLTPLDHPDLRPWIKHEDWPGDAYPLRKSFKENTSLRRARGEYRFVAVEGGGPFEIPVGPVHAGIIEPGHFRFQAIGENIINLETKFGYVHKGIEKRFESLQWRDAARLAGRVSGDSTVAHSTAFCAASEEASGHCEPPLRAKYLRAIMLERERIANHFGDIGAICNDTGFAFLYYQFSTLRETMLKTNRKVFGHRLMMDCVTPGGVGADVSSGAAANILEEIDTLAVEFEKLIAIYENNPSLEDRIYGAGILSPEIALSLGVVGFVARASGQNQDVRLQRPCPPYDRHIPVVPVLSSGDVHARAWIRIEEIRDSFRLLREIIQSLPEGPLTAEWIVPPQGASGFSSVEGWRGEIIYWVQCGLNGAINRCMVRDPSSVNWLALEQAVKGNIVPDFPLCNKSFNQSYSGHDL